MRLALGKEKSITFLCGVVILYFQYNLGRILEEIYYSRFWFLYYSISISQSASRYIYGAWVLLTSIFAVASPECKHSCNWDICDTISANISAKIEVTIGGRHDCDSGTYDTSSICASSGNSTEDKHNAIKVYIKPHL